MTAGEASPSRLGDGHPSRPAPLANDEPLPAVYTPPVSPARGLGGDAILTPNQEYTQVKHQLDEPLKAGDAYYLINRRWYVEWLAWVGDPDMRSPKMGPMADPLALDLPALPLDDTTPPEPFNSAKRARQRSWTKDRPGPLDNSELLEVDNGNVKLRKQINEHSDYEIVPDGAWIKIQEWYGGGPQIKRRAILSSNGKVQIELHGLLLKIFKSSDKDTPTPLEVTESKMTTFNDFKASACKEMALDPAKVRVWDYFSKRLHSLIEGSDDKTLDQCKIFDDNPIMLEEQGANGVWPYEDSVEEHDTVSDLNQVTATGVGYTYGGGSSSASYGQGGGGNMEVTRGDPPQRGVVGLQNLGNTCFMNSSLQCLSNAPMLREFFLAEAYKQDLNREAHRTNGKLAESFAELLGMMWEKDTVKVAPRNFKWQIGQFAEQFTGYGQQDSMELIEYVLDGLKEDCNLVRGPKPYVEVKEADGRSDKEVAEEAMENYKRRSNSKIDDLFVGLLKSCVRCPESVEKCGRTSVTFDPFLSAKLPLVSSAEQRCTTFPVTFVRDNVASGAESIVQVSVKVNKEANIRALIESACREVEGVSPDSCVLIEVWNKKVQKYFEDTESVESIRAGDFLLLCEVGDPKAFQISTSQRWGSTSPVEGSASPAGDGSFGVVIYHRCTSSSTSQYRDNKDIVGLPILLSVSKNVTGQELGQEVERKIRETVLEPGAEMPKWELVKVARYREKEDGTPVDLESNGPLGLESTREHLAIDWPEGMVLPARLTMDRSHQAAAYRGPEEQDLTELFKYFVEEEKLGADDAWYCNKCKEHVEAYKKLEFHKTPPVLIVQLKRFQYTRWSRERLNNPVRFPLEGLDLAPFCTESAAQETDPSHFVYDLTGVSKHIGQFSGGHYIAYCRSSEDGKWYNFDDSRAREVSPQEVEEDKVGAYILFYLRRDHRPPAFGTPHDDLATVGEN